MRSRTNTLAITLTAVLALTVNATAHNTLLKIPTTSSDTSPHTQAEELQQHTGHDATIIHTVRPITESTNLTLRSYNPYILIGPITNHDADLIQQQHPNNERIDLTTTTVTFHIDLGSYRSQSTINRIEHTTHNLNIPTQREYSNGITTINAGPYHTIRDAHEALQRITPHLTNTTAHLTLTTTPTPPQQSPSQPTTQNHATTLNLELGAYLHVRTHSDLNLIEAQQGTLEQLGLPSSVIVTGETERERYRLFVGPIDPETIDTTMQLLRSNGIASYVAADQYGAAPPRPTPPALTDDGEAATEQADQPASAERASDKTPDSEHSSAATDHDQDASPERADAYLWIGSSSNPDTISDLERRAHSSSAPLAVRERDGALHLFLGPIAGDDIDYLRLTLRQAGIASVIYQQPIGDRTTINAYLNTLTSVEAEHNEEAGENDTPTLADDATLAPHDADMPAPAPRALDGTPTINILDLPDGLHLRVQTTREPAQLAPERDALDALELPSVVVPTGSRYSLVTGPIDASDIDDLRITLRGLGIASSITGNPDYLARIEEATHATDDLTPPDATITTEAQPTTIDLDDPSTLTHPRNYLLLTAHPDTPDAVDQLDASIRDDLINATDPHTGETLTLIGPIPNDELESVAASIELRGSISTYPMPALEDGALLDEWIALGYRLIALQAPHEARRAFLEARAIDVVSYEALFGLALSEDLIGNDAAAEFAYQHVLSLHPDRFDARYNYALRTLRIEGPQTALQHHFDALAIAQAHGSTSKLTLAHLALAHNLSLAGQHADAATHYQATYDLTNDLDHLILRLDAQRTQGISLPLLPELTELERDTRDIRFTTMISSIYLEHEQTEYALDALERRIRMNDDSDHPHDIADLINTIASVHAAEGDTGNAAIALARAAEVAPEHATTRYNQALLKLALGDTRSAISEFQTAFELGLDDPLAYLDLAEAAHRVRDHITTINASREALQNISDSTHRARALTLLVDAHLALGQRTAAHQSAQDLIELAPNDPQALTLAGAAAYAVEAYPSAAEHLLNAYRLTGDPQRRHPLARALLAAERYSEARNLYIELTLERPNDATIKHELGWVHLRLGDNDAARNAWNDAKNLGSIAASNDLSSVFGE